MSVPDFSIPLYNRETQNFETEQVFEAWFMDFFYGQPLGRLLEYSFIQRKWFSWIYGKLQERPERQKIQRFIEKYEINLAEIADPLEHFHSFQDFFIRKLKPEFRPIESQPHRLIAPADGRLLVIPIEKQTVIPVKGRRFSLEALLQNRSLSHCFQDGLCLIFRLAPVDYHRFGYIDAGYHGPHTRLGGLLRTVSPYALQQGLKVFTQNERQYTLLKTQNFGRVLHLDIGALVVGKIIQRHFLGTQFQRGQEKGYFKFGASTIILIFQANTLTIDADILKASAQGIEALVKYGSSIGERQ